MEIIEVKYLIWNNKFDEFKKVISKNLDFYINEDKSMLLTACNSGKLKFARYLIENGADINFPDNSGYTPINLAAAYGNNIELVEYLFEQGANLNIIAKYSNGIIGELASNYKSTELLIKIINESNTITPYDLERVLAKKDIEIFKYIINNKNVPAEIIVDSLRGLFLSPNNEPIKIIDYLLGNNYIQINEKDSHGNRLLKVITLNSKDITVPKYLIENGADINIDNTGISCFISMVREHNLEGVKYFISQGVDINSISDSYNQNALHYEASSELENKKAPELLKYLVENGADLTLIGGYNNVLPIHNSHYYKRTASVKYLYENTINAIISKIGKENNEILFNKLFSIQEIAGNKKEKEFLINSMMKFPQFVDRFIEQINSDKMKLREFAIKFLIKLNDNKNLIILKDRLEVESNKSLLKVLTEYLNTKTDIIENIKEKVRNPDDYKINSKEWFDVVAENENSNIPISWLKINELPEVLWNDSNKMNSKTIKYFLKLLMSNSVSSELLNLINSNSLIELFNILYAMPKKINKNDIWIFNILFMLAEKDSKYINSITDKIENFIRYSRWTMGSKLLYPLAKIKNIDGLKKVDWYSRKFKHKGIKNDATYILNNIAKEKNITIEEIRDSLISNFGFNKDKELILDYGSRKIIVKLIPDFKYSFKNEEGKVFKSLPKPNKKDDQEIANQSVIFFKSMKKEIKDILKTQKERLEYQFKVLSLKDFSYWNNFYIKNPILNLFAENLFWGVYKNNKLEKVFIYSEDGSYLDLEQNEIRLKETDKIGLLHPIELTEKELIKAMELIDNYEIIQPLNQVNRSFFKTDKKEKELTDFKDMKFYTKSTHYKLLKLGWERGYIVDNGFFENYIMNIRELKITASLEFSGADMYLEYTEEPSVWGKVTFTNNGITIPLDTINKRVYSEIYKTLEQVSKIRIK